MILLALLLGSLPGPEAPPGGCTQEIRWFVRDDDPATVLLRATPDSISDGEYYEAVGNIERAPIYPGARPHRVFAQVFELISASGPEAEQVQRHDRVAVVWWQLGLTCRRWFPRESVRMPEGELFLAKQPRDVAEWIDGVPTYDVLAGDWYYSSARPGVESVRSMSVAEYADLYRILPSSESLSRDRTAVLERLLRWGEQDAQRWHQYPARQVLCEASERLGRSDRRECS